MKFLSFAAVLVGGLALVAAGVVVGREKPAIQLIRETVQAPAEQCEPAPFVAVSFAAPPKPEAKPQAKPQAKPSAPPLPFRYMGSVIADGKLEVFVLRGDQPLSVAPGEELGGDYRVESVTPREIVFTYLPLNIKQALPL
jgi:hypothetical protein